MRIDRRVGIALVALLVVVGIGIALLAGGGDDGEETTASNVATQGASGPDAEAGGDKETQPGDGEEGGGDPAAGGSGDSGGSDASAEGANGKPSWEDVDLSVDPASIRGARVTQTGAVQTLPPQSEDHDTAQENSYASIRDFGEEAEGEEATNITFALVQFLDAKAQGDWATACARLYSPLRESVEENGKSGDCAEIFGALMGRVPQSAREEQAEIDISSIRRGDGNRAFVIYKTPETLSADMPMYVEDGDWKVGAVEAYALRPDQVR